MSTEFLCIYHANCMDGFTAAWAVYKKLGKEVCEFVPASYGDEPPSVIGKHVIIVDFSYPKDTLCKMATEARSVVVLDHHKTAEAALKDLPASPCSLDKHIAMIDTDEARGVHSLYPYVLFDMERSGAMITWDFCFPGSLPPSIVAYVQDRDLWKFEFMQTRAVHAAMSSYEQTFENWDKFEEMGSARLALEGIAIDRKFRKDLDALLSIVWTRGSIAGYDVPVVNLPPMFASEAGNIMAKGELFAATYYLSGEYVIYSLRSAPDGMDVSEVAEMFGGGGHKHSAGFKLPRGGLEIVVGSSIKNGGF